MIQRFDISGIEGWANKRFAPTKFGLKSTNGESMVAVGARSVLSVYECLHEDFPKVKVDYVGGMCEMTFDKLMEEHGPDAANHMCNITMGPLKRGKKASAATYHSDATDSNHIVFADYFMHMEPDDRIYVENKENGFLINDMELKRWTPQGSALLHEFGHCFGYSLNEQPFKKMKKWMNLQADKMGAEKFYRWLSDISLYCTDSAHEAFAESFIAAYLDLPQYRKHPIVKKMDEIIQEFA